MNETHAEYAAKLSAYQRMEIDEERAAIDAIHRPWEMTLEEMDLALSMAMRGRISNEHKARIQALIDALDDIVTTAPTYLIEPTGEQKS